MVSRTDVTVFARRHPIVAAIWLIAALVATVQVARWVGGTAGAIAAMRCSTASG